MVMPRILCLFALLIASTADTAATKTWFIKPNGTGDAPHIAAGVDSCMPGDSLLLDTGTFTGANNRQITVDKDIVICSVAGPAATTIDCQRSGMAFDFVGATATLKGLTIAWSWTQAGETAPVLLRLGASVEVSDCSFYNGRGSEVGAIQCDDAASYLDASNCEFRDNWGGTLAGAIASSNGPIDVRDCWFESNVANNKTGALRMKNSSGVIEGNTFWKNTGSYEGAAVALAGITTRFEHNTVVGNGGLSGAVRVGGWYVSIGHNIIAFNSVPAFDCTGSYDSPDIRCNNLFGNTDNDVCPGASAGDNVVADPYFCDAANGVFELDAASPSAPANNTCGMLYGAWPVVCTVVGIDDAAPSAGYQLLGNAPNPFNPETTIRYHVPNGGTVTLEIFDISGARVRTYSREHSSAGIKQLIWDGRDDCGREVSSGVYIYRMTAPGFAQSQKMLLLK